MSGVPEVGRVFLVGAGPGDPDLLTVRAARLLKEADVILHDDLVPAAVLQLAGKGALVTSVGKRCGRPRITQAGIHQLMIEAARAGQHVVRLKAGDPLIFGRAGEEIAALRNAGIPFEVVPGITAALAAGAAYAVPFTDRQYASKLIFLTGHHASEKRTHSSVWSGPLPSDATLVIYMPGRDLQRLQADLLDAGLAADTPWAAFSNLATTLQQHVTGVLSGMSATATGPAPLLLVVGRAMEPLLAAAAAGLGFQPADSGEAGQARAANMGA